MRTAVIVLRAADSRGTTFITNSVEDDEGLGVGRDWWFDTTATALLEILGLDIASRYCGGLIRIGLLDLMDCIRKEGPAIITTARKRNKIEKQQSKDKRTLFWDDEYRSIVSLRREHVLFVLAEDGVRPKPKQQKTTPPQRPSDWRVSCW